jgi:beta-phosphoglucomutase
MIQAIICDFDGLIADSEWIHCHSLIKALRDHQFQLTEEQYIDFWIRQGKRLIDYFSINGVREDVIDSVRRVRNSYRNVMIHESLQFMPGARQFLERFYGKTKIGLATGSPRTVLEEMFMKLPCLHFFDAVVSIEDVKLGKPSPDIFLLVSNQLNIQPTGCLVIGDSANDIVAAHRVGMPAIAVPNRYTQNSDFTTAIHIVSSLDEITDELIARI